MKLKTIDLKQNVENYSITYTLVIDISENTDEEKVKFLNDMFSNRGFSVSKIKNQVHLSYDAHDRNELSDEDIKEFLENISYSYMVMISNKNEILELLSEFYLKYHEFA